MSVKVLHDSDLNEYLKSINTIKIMEETFAALAKGLVVQPPQTLTVFPENKGDYITYLGALSHYKVFGTKVSPYIPTNSVPIITAWTLLMSMETGLPLLLCDSARLTRERTAATTALAIDKLAREDDKVLAIIGSGNIAYAHLLHVMGLRNWREIRVYSLNIIEDSKNRDMFTKADPRVKVCHSSKECINDADTIMLCTSSGKPVINIEDIGKPALITSISTNVQKAHEIEPDSLALMDVYCDYKATTPLSAGEMLLAAELGWSKNNIAGDLADLCTGNARMPKYDKNVFFRSIGLGIEDIAIAYAIYKQAENK